MENNNLPKLSQQRFDGLLQGRFVPDESAKNNRLEAQNKDSQILEIPANNVELPFVTEMNNVREKHRETIPLENYRNNKITTDSKPIEQNKSSSKNEVWAVVGVGVLATLIGAAAFKVDQPINQQQHNQMIEQRK